jgi:hypothetical protein
MRNRLIGGVAALAVVAILAAVPAVRADGWGTVKGQVVWSGDIPAPEPLKVDKDQAACMANGPLLSEKYVIDPKSKGVRYVMVWLADPKSPTKALPISRLVSSSRTRSLCGWGKAWKREIRPRSPTTSRWMAV